MSADDKKSGGGWGCLVIIAILVLAYLGREHLAKHGVLNTVSLRYGVTKDRTLFSGERITGIFLENPDNNDPHINAQVELEIILKDGDVLNKTFSVGTIRPGDKWSKVLDSPLTEVSRIDFFYTCKTGACKGTLDIEHPENNKSRAAIEKVLKLDQEAGRGDGGASQVTAAMRAIDLSDCPDEFREAYKEHIHAWAKDDSEAVHATFAEVKRIAHEYGIVP